MKTLAERFWEKVQKRDGCWLWTAAINSAGYGVLNQGKPPRMVYAHRIAWELENGPIPDGLFVLHHCDCKPCVRLDHLFIGDQADNMQDAIKKGRIIRVGEKDPNSKLTVEQIIEIRSIDASYGQLAKQFAVSRSAIQHIKERRNWSHI
jgi:hypothetical protein